MSARIDIAARLEAAFNARDAAALASLYSQTAVLMPPNEPMVSGRANIQAWFESALQRLESVSIAPLESTVVGDRAFQVGTFTSRRHTDASSSAQDSRTEHVGKYVLLLEHSVGEWRIQYDIWSLDQ